MPSKAWIRGPLWDCIWIVNGPALGVLAAIASRWVPPFYLLVVPAIFVQKAHNLAPVVHAWGRSDFREIMLRDQLRFLWIPLAILLFCLLTGLVAGLTGRQDLPYCLVMLITLWNLHHFASQNFGLLSLYRARQPECLRQRRLDRLFCFFVMLVAVPLMICTANWSPFLSGMALRPAHPVPALDALRVPSMAATLVFTAAMVVRELGRVGVVSKPRVLLLLQVGLPAAIGFWQPLFFWTSVAVSHWCSSIGINAHAFGRRRPSARFLWLTLASYLLLLPFSNAAFDFVFSYRHIPVGNVLRNVLFASFAAQSAIHFLYDRHLFKLSRPEVRETIGRDLLPA